MKRIEEARQIAKTLLVSLLVLELLAAWELWRHGPPMIVTDFKGIGSGAASFRMKPSAPGPSDYGVLTAAIALQAASSGYLWLTSGRYPRFIVASSDADRRVMGRSPSTPK